jgi:hypothetical protein
VLQGLLAQQRCTLLIHEWCPLEGGAAVVTAMAMNVVTMYTAMLRLGPGGRGDVLVHELASFPQSVRKEATWLALERLSVEGRRMPRKQMCHCTRQL